ncbi:MAG: aminoacyl-tRNA hydrolase [Nitrospirae bacterium]|nr:aminoacyl-tRNA hydrolase [Nitrospirota bacterium]
MWLVVGLGNPGEAYVTTRHNIGFMVINALSDRFSIPLKQKRRNFEYGRGFMEEKEVLLIKPLTFMNRSGMAVREALKGHEDTGNLIVIHDELDLEPGIIRIKKSGSSGGHRGVESIIEMLGTKDFLRLRVGIGRSKRLPPEVYVLTRFPKADAKMVKESVDTAVNAVIAVISKGLSSAQNEFHRD